MSAGNAPLQVTCQHGYDRLTLVSETVPRRIGNGIDPDISLKILIRKSLMKLPQTLFTLTAVATTVFVITILAMVAMLLGDPEAPVNVWFNRQGATVMTFEVLAIGFFGSSAIFFDRREILREQRQKKGPPKS
jgi:hypothetical protein